MDEVWYSESKGKSHGLIGNVDGEFGTKNLWVVSVDETGMNVKELTPTMRKVVNVILRERRPEIANLDDFLVSCKIKSGKPPGREGIIQIPFTAAVNDSSKGEFGLNGVVTVRLSDGEVMGASSDARRLKPFVTNMELRKADEELNTVYHSALKSLPPKEAEGLQRKQRAWIAQRDNDATQAVNVTPYGSTHEIYEQAREDSLIESTKKRIQGFTSGIP